MRIPFFSKLAPSPFLEMEEIIDKVCREFLRNPSKEYTTYLELGEDENKIIYVYNQIKENLPVFYEACIYLEKNPNPEELSKQMNCCISYGKALLEIQKNQRYSYEFINN